MKILPDRIIMMQQLPSDVINEIFRELDLPHRWIFRQTCRKFRKPVIRPPRHYMISVVTTSPTILWLKSHNFFDNPIIRYRVFKFAAMDSRLEIIRELLAAGIVLDNRRVNDILFLVRDREITEWFVVLNPFISYRLESELFRKYAHRGDLAFAQWLYEKLHLKSIDKHRIIMSCNYESVMQWLSFA